MMWIIVSLPLWIIGLLAFSIGAMATFEWVRQFRKTPVPELASAFKGIVTVMLVAFVAMAIAVKVAS